MSFLKLISKATNTPSFGDSLFQAAVQCIERLPTVALKVSFILGATRQPHTSIPLDLYMQQMRVTANRTILHVILLPTGRGIDRNHDFLPANVTEIGCLVLHRRSTLGKLGKNSNGTIVPTPILGSN